MWTKPPKTNTHEWARSISLVLALPMFFVLMGLAIHGCGAPCHCASSIVQSHLPGQNAH